VSGTDPALDEQAVAADGFGMMLRLTGHVGYVVVCDRLCGVGNYRAN